MGSNLKNKQGVAAAVFLALGLVVGLSATRNLGAQALVSREAVGPTIKTADLRSGVDDFLSKELAVHLGAIKSLDLPPDRLLGVPTTGEFSWGTFMRSLAAYAEESGQHELGGRDLAKWVGQIGLIEARAGSKAFSQLFAALALRHFGRDLKTNPLWQGLSPEEQKAWRSLLNPERFYDPNTNRVIDLPENYLGVAARIASIDYDLGISSDRVFLDKLLDRAAIQFTSGKLFADDAPPTGRYDRYSNEYARYVWEAAEMAGRQDILDRLRPSLSTQMRLWWDVVSTDGYGYNWGRSQGVVSYLDTPEIVGFLASHPEFRPAPLADLAALYYQSWNYLVHDYRSDAHLLSLFAFGRGNYSYITREREWQQTTGFFGKLANSHPAIMNALEKEHITSFPAVPGLTEVARFEFFRRAPERAAGVWLVRQGPLRFALPLTTGPKAGISDYLPAPFGLTGFAAPVEQSYPSLTPYLELADGRVAVAADGADSIEPSPDGQSLRARWSRWVVVGDKPGAWLNVGLTSEVVWRIANGTLTREETVSASRAVNIRRWQLAVPTSYAKVDTETKSGVRSDRFSSNDGILTVVLSDTSFPVSTSIMATGDGPLGRGVRGAIPLHLQFEARNLVVDAGKPLKYRLTLTPQSSQHQLH
ncbi:MAG TPA: hypothetical protein VKB46_01530 [Pyrinomonadaceae bacterium]|nr:hypothetical protein [Pyrinomonadaceae bacterium]